MQAVKSDKSSFEQEFDTNVCLESLKDHFLQQQALRRRKLLSPKALRKIEQILPKRYTARPDSENNPVVAPKPPKSYRGLSAMLFVMLSFLALAAAAYRDLGPSDNSLSASSSYTYARFRRMVAQATSANPTQSQAQLPGPIVFRPGHTPGSAVFSDNREVVQFLTKRILLFRPASNDANWLAAKIVDISEENGLNPFFVASIISSESSFRNTVHSRVGAVGLMQLRPSTAKAVLRDLTAEGDTAKIKTLLYNHEINIRLGVQYFKQLEKRFRGDRYLALAAYNWGPTNLVKSRRRGERIPRSVRKYANKIIARTSRWDQQFASSKLINTRTASLSSSEKSSALKQVSLNSRVETRTDGL